MNKLKVYLCGPILGCTDEQCKDWRESAKKRFPAAIDPMRRDYRGREEECYNEIVELDKTDIKECDCLLVNYDKPSVGTSMEVFYAWELCIPVFVVAKPETIVSPWLKYHSTKFFTSFEDAFKHLENGFFCLNV